jgi:AcrR family transcriptional regulator
MGASRARDDDQQPAGEAGDAADAGAGTPALRPPAPGKRAERRAFRRDEILQTALALVDEGGLDAVTTTELARRTGAALGALYRFFPSKAAVIAALQRQAVDELRADLARATTTAAERAAARGPRVQALAALVAIADVVFGEPRSHPPRFRLVDEALSRLQAVHADADAVALEAALRPLLALAHERVIAFANAAGSVEGAVVDGAHREELERFSFALWAALHGVTHFIKRDRLVPPSHTSARVATTTVRLLLRGLGAADVEIAAAWAAARPHALASLDPV